MKFPEKNTRQKILETTMAFFCVGDFDPSMTAIAKKVGISKAAIYYFFENKSALFAAAISAAPAEMARHFEKIADGDAPADEKIIKIFRFFAKKMREKKAFSQILLRRLSTRDEKLLAEMAAHRQKMVLKIRDLFRDGQKNGIFRDFSPEKMAEMFFGFFDFLFLFSAICPENADKKCFLAPPEKTIFEFLSLLKK